MWRIRITTPLHTDRIKLVGESKKLLAAGERERYAAHFTDRGNLAGIFRYEQTLQKENGKLQQRRL